jgi:glycine C-acetyltransferase
MLLKPNNFIGNLQKNTRHFRDAMTKAGFTISGQDHPISPVMLGEAKLAQEMASEMLKEGIYVIGFSFPVVPKGKARIRVQISAAHTEEEIEQAINAFIKVGRKLNVIK